MSQNSKSTGISRRTFVAGTAAGITAPLIVPRNVLGGPGETAPSEEFGGALIGCGGRGKGTFKCLGPGVRKLAECDVKFKDRADNKTVYTDFRRVLERDDIDVVAIATHPGWHALISIAAMEAGKDVVCEKPMCRFISEGRAVAEAEKRYGRVFQIERKGGYKPNTVRKIFESGLLKDCDSVLVRRGRAGQPRLGHVLRPGPATTFPETPQWRQPSRVLGLRRWGPGRHGASPPAWFSL